MVGWALTNLMPNMGNSFFLVSVSRQLSKLHSTTKNAIVKPGSKKVHAASRKGLDVAEQLERGGKGAPQLTFPRPLTTVDVVIFAARGDALQGLLVQRGADDSAPCSLAWAR